MVPIRECGIDGLLSSQCARQDAIILVQQIFYLIWYIWAHIILWCAIAPSADRVCCVVIWQVCLLPVRAACWQTDWQDARAALAELSPVCGAETFPAGHMACRIRDGQSRNKTRAKQTCFNSNLKVKNATGLSIYQPVRSEWTRVCGRVRGDERRISAGIGEGQWIKNVKSLISSLVLNVGLNIIFITVRWWNQFFQGPCFAVVFQLSFCTQWWNLLHKYFYFIYNIPFANQSE